MLKLTKIIFFAVETKRVYEGDIFLDQNTQYLLRTLRRRPVRSAISAPHRKWSSNKIPYDFGGVSKYFHFFLISSNPEYQVYYRLLFSGSSVKEAVKHAILEFEKHTCIKFVPRKREKDYVHIVSYGKK